MTFQSFEVHGGNVGENLDIKSETGCSLNEKLEFFFIRLVHYSLVFILSINF